MISDPEDAAAFAGVDDATRRLLNGQSFVGGMGAAYSHSKTKKRNHMYISTMSGGAPNGDEAMRFQVV
jgi:hypothetical protein